MSRSERAPLLGYSRVPVLWMENLPVSEGRLRYCGEQHLRAKFDCT